MPPHIKKLQNRLDQINEQIASLKAKGSTAGLDRLEDQQFAHEFQIELELKKLGNQPAKASAPTPEKPKPKPAPAAVPTTKASPVTQKVWESSLSEPERQAIEDWTVGTQELWGAIRQGETNEQVKALESALQRAPNYQGTTYRGAGFDTADEALAFFDGEFTVPQLWSSSKDAKAAQEFANTSKDVGMVPVMITAKTRTGVDIESLAEESMQDQKEVVWRPGSRYRVTDRYMNGGTLYVKAEEITVNAPPTFNSAREELRYWSAVEQTLNNCGTGGGGFKPGNSCAKGGKGGGGKSKAGGSKKKPGIVGKTAAKAAANNKMMILKDVDAFMLKYHPDELANNPEAAEEFDHLAEQWAEYKIHNGGGGKIGQKLDSQIEAIADEFKAAKAKAAAAPITPTADNPHGFNPLQLEAYAAMKAQADIEQKFKAGELDYATYTSKSKEQYKKVSDLEKQGLYHGDLLDVEAVVDQEVNTLKKQGNDIASVPKTPAVDPPPKSVIGDPDSIVKSTVAYHEKHQTIPPTTTWMTKVQTLGGSTGAELYQDAHGTKFVVKKGNHTEHIAEEAFANQLYKAAGVAVPASSLGNDTDGNLVQIARFVEGKSLGSLSGAEKQAAIKKVQENFAVDALLANWDVAGMGMDNILIANNGDVLRIDNGGSLRYRAQGKPKGVAFGDQVVELETMRQMGSAAPVFKDLSDADVAAQIHALSAKRQAILNAAPNAELKTKLEKRLDYMEDWAAKKTGKPNASTPPATAKTTSGQSGAGVSLGGMTQAFTSAPLGPSNPPKSMWEVKQLIDATKGDTYYSDLQIAKIMALNPDGLKGGEFYIGTTNANKTHHDGHIAHLQTVLPPGTKIVKKPVSSKVVLEAGLAPKGAVKGAKSGKGFDKAAALELAKAGSKPEAVGVVDGKTMTFKGPNGPVSLDDISHVTPKGVKLVGAKTLPGIGTGQIHTGTIKLNADGILPTPTAKSVDAHLLYTWSNGLKSDEKAAIQSWSGGGYIQMRQNFGKGEIGATEKALLSGLSSAPIFQGTVYRGIKLKDHKGEAEDYGLKLVQSITQAGIGAIWTDPAPMSTSRRYDKAYNFAGGDNGLILRIKSKTMRAMESVSYYGAEAEVMGTGQQQFRVTGIAKNVKTTSSYGLGQKVIIDLEEI